MSKKEQLATGSPWEDIVAYSRAVRVGNTIEVSGTTSTRNGEVLGKDAYTQTRIILEIISESLEKLGSGINDVIRTRIFVTDITQWEHVARAHREFFENIKPVTTMVEVSSLIHPDLIVEIEASAILSV